MIQIDEMAEAARPLAECLDVGRAKGLASLRERRVVDVAGRVDIGR
ncbi:hypothetical protein [Rhodanobacter sp. B04]|nr:hypothetical protein [Rhodanobacter sp. B04]